MHVAMTVGPFHALRGRRREDEVLYRIMGRDDNTLFRRPGVEFTIIDRFGQGAGVRPGGLARPASHYEPACQV